jgi:hypothetical protein
MALIELVSVEAEKQVRKTSQKRGRRARRRKKEQEAAA